MTSKLFLAVSAACIFMSQAHAMEVVPEQTSHPRIQLNKDNILSANNRKVALEIYRGAYQALETEKRAINRNLADIQIREENQRIGCQESGEKLYEISSREEVMHDNYHNPFWSSLDESHTPDYHQRVAEIGFKKLRNAGIERVRSAQYANSREFIELNNIYYPNLGNISYRDLENLKKAAQNFYNTLEDVTKMQQCEDCYSDEEKQKTYNLNSRTFYN